MTGVFRGEQLEDGGRVLPESRPQGSWDEQAVVQAYLTHFQGLSRYAASMLSGDMQAVADALQDTFVIVQAQWEKLSDPRAILAWMYSILGRVCLRTLRSYARTVNIDAADEINLLPTVESAEGTALSNLESSAMAAAVRQLSPRQRQTLTLSMTGHTIAEISDRLGIDANAVRVNLHHARKKMKALLDGGAAAI